MHWWPCQKYDESVFTRLCFATRIHMLCRSQLAKSDKIWVTLRIARLNVVCFPESRVEIEVAFDASSGFLHSFDARGATSRRKFWHSEVVLSDTSASTMFFDARKLVYPRLVFFFLMWRVVALFIFLFLTRRRKTGHLSHHFSFSTRAGGVLPVSMGEDVSLLVPTRNSSVNNDIIYFLERQLRIVRTKYGTRECQ